MGRNSYEVKLENQKNMRGMINDYKIQGRGFPTNEDFITKLGVSLSTVKRYRKTIHEETKHILLERFENEIVNHIDELLTIMNENVKFFKDTRDDSTTPKDIRIKAANNLSETKLDIIRVMRDTPKFIDYDSDYITGRRPNKNDPRDYDMNQDMEHQTTCEGFKELFASDNT